MRRGDALVFGTESEANMKFSEYQTASARTLNTGLPQADALANYALGLAGEAGEAVELVKKHLYHGKPLDLDAVKKELGDSLWYIAALASTLGLDMGEIAESNISKLVQRYPDKFVHGGGNR